ncbi:VanZ family protein [Brachybacterium sp. GCM10030267]|uniref:VanZ family protein n=1 Tax=Brachybacterium sp. GCM10030267 TaxID=3273381 RepID=UPI0036221E9E
MIDAWAWQIPFSLLGGTLCFLAVLLPILIIQYYAYGRLSPARLIGAAGVAIYAVALVAYTLLPLPDPSVCAGGGGTSLQPVPLATIGDIARLAGQYGLGSTTTIAAIAQPILNVVLFIPLGVLIRVMAGRGILTATLTGVAASLLIETTQYTGLWGLFDCAYRVADVDDLLTNTAGALIGALLAPVVAGWIPEPTALATLPPRPVTRLRRLLGMAIDAAVISALPGLLLTAGLLTYVVVWTLASDGGEVPNPPGHAAVLPLASILIGALLSVVLPALIGSGASPGQRMVGIVPVFDGRRGSAGRRLTRALSVAGLYAALAPIGDVLEGLGVPVLPVLLRLASGGLVLVAIAIVLFVDRRGLSGLISGADLVDRRAARR